MRDVNMEIAGQLNDLALVHASKHGRFAYKKASRAILELAQPLDEWVEAHSPREIPYIGPATEHVILEHLAHGHGRSATVERAVDESGKREEIVAAREHRTHFLSRAGVLRVLSANKKGAVGLSDYRGDLQTHSEWSDGGESISTMAAAARARGHAYLGVSDHSYGLKIAHGMSMQDARRRGREIEALNREWDGEFRVISAPFTVLRSSKPPRRRGWIGPSHGLCVSSAA